MGTVGPEAARYYRVARSYLIALVAVAGVVALRALLHSSLADRHYFFFPLAAVSITIAFAGSGPAIVAAVVAFLFTNWLFIPPTGQFSLLKMPEPDRVGAIAYFALSGLIIWFGHLARRKASRLLEQQRQHLAELDRREASHARLASIVESSAEAIIAKDLNSNITNWNKGAENLFGYAAEEMIGTSVMRLLPDDRKHEEEHILSQLRQGQAIISFNTKRLHKNGALIDVSITISPLRNTERKPLECPIVRRGIEKMGGRVGLSSVPQQGSTFWFELPRAKLA